MKSSKSSLFLLELIIAILFFSISAAACIQLFAKAHAVDIRTVEQNQAIIWSQNLAELWRHSNGDLTFVEKQIKEDYFFPEGSAVCNISGNTANSAATLTFYFDKNWVFITGNPTYRIVLESSFMPDENAMLHASIRFYKDTEPAIPFYELPLQLYVTETEVSVYE